MRRTPYISIGSPNETYQVVKNRSIPLRAAGSLNSEVYLSGEIDWISGTSPMALAASAVACVRMSAFDEIGLVAMTIFLPAMPASATRAFAFATS